MGHHEMRVTYIDTLLRERVEEPRIGEAHWRVTVDEIPVDIVLVESGAARVVCSAPVGGAPVGTDQQLDLQRDLPFGRLDVRDGQLVASHSLFVDGVTGAALDNAVRFVAWAADTVGGDVDPQLRLDGVDHGADGCLGTPTEPTRSAGAVPHGVVGAEGYL